MESGTKGYSVKELNFRRSKNGKHSNVRLRHCWKRSR